MSGKTTDFMQNIMSRYFFFLFLAFGSIGFAQKKPIIKVAADTTLIKIGEQINLTVSVKVDSTRSVNFPELKQFGSFEIIEESPIDTFREKDLFNLIKKYGLTKFDSGSYVIPSFPIVVSNQSYPTDSIAVRVLDVEVDTLKQKMYDIKDIIAVHPKSNFWAYFWWTLGTLLVLGAVAFYLWLKNKAKKEAEEELPPYEKAVSELQKLDNFSLHEQADYKHYYSKVTDVLKIYYESEVHVDVMECTSDELLEKIELLVDSGQIKLEKGTLIKLQETLKTSDLVKFAKYSNTLEDARSDRDNILQFISLTHETLPEPTEEELMAGEQRRVLQAKRRKKRRLLVAASIAGLILLGTGGVMIAKYGFRASVDTLFRKTSKLMLDGDWVYSEYGYPPVGIETPEVLKQVKVPIPAGNEKAIVSMTNYAYENLGKDLYIVVNHVNFNPQLEITNDQVSELSAGELKQRFGLEDFQLKSEDITIDEINGTHKTGNFFKDSMVYQFDVYTFFAKPSLRQIVVVYKKNDLYYPKISKRIFNSIKLLKGE